MSWHMDKDVINNKSFNSIFTASLFFHNNNEVGKLKNRKMDAI